MSTPSLAQLKHAVTLAEEIAKLQAQLAGLFGGSSSVAADASIGTPSKKKPGKRTRSPETIVKMKAAQQARWAKQKGPTAGVVSPLDQPNQPKKAGKEKGITPEGRAKLAAAMKARWAAKKKAAK